MFCFRDKAQVVTFGKGILLTVLGSGEKLNATHWSTPAGTVSPSHEHPEEQIGYVIKGRIEVTIGRETSELKTGDCYFIAGNMPHHFRLIEDSEVIDIFSPPRPIPKPENIIDDK
ncbi:MAG: hypothetical protein A2Y97_13805 [Nitrospirae bacterium RBG_13_39_12]|nr:MAG: hypothetical protein A2Y97_13805 [Nitrospirae bacterium RBG_13_39_12]